MKIKNIALLSILVAATNLFIGCSSMSTITGDKLIKKDNDKLIVQSNVDMTDTNVNSQLPGKIKEVKVNEGDSVEKGQVLMIMDSDSLSAQQSQVQAQIEAATAQVKAAKAARDAANSKLEQAQNGARPEEIDQAKAAYDLAKATYDRLQILYEEDSISKSDLDNAETQMKVAKDKYDIAEQGARPEEIKAAQAQVDQANASV